ncbi:hypothetical protein D770_14345 [Flammeovirgaceae bacterium 311]|nr:hypothetical protein D770_14345 [Flammeovirgaceae bacterium 311]
MKAAILLIAFLGITSIAKSQPGILDPEFGSKGGYTLTRFSNGGSGFHGIAIQSDGKIVVAGDEHKGESAVFALARYNQNGQLDASFGSGGKVLTDFDGGNDRARSVAIQNNGKIIVGGYTYNGRNFDFGLARYERDGSLDKNFGDHGKIVTPLGSRSDLARSMILQPNGWILMTGEFWKEEGGVISSDFVLVRYKSNGKLDENFGTDGTVVTDFNGENDKPRAVAVQSDGKIIVAGQSYINRKADFSLVRYNRDGSPDTSFGSHGDGKVVTEISAGDDLAISIAIQPDGKIVLAGEAHNGSNLDIALVRYNTNGSLDSSFGTRGDGKIITDFDGSNDNGRSISLQADGKIIVAGQTTKGNNGNAALVRYNANGSLDTSFGTRGDGKVVTDFGGANESINATIIVGERLLAAGHFSANANPDTEEALIAAYDLSEVVLEDVLLSVTMDKAAAEDDKDGFFEVAVSKALTTDLTIRYSMTGTAEKGKDYNKEPAENELVLKAGKTEEKIKIIPVADEEVEESETIVLTLQTPSAAGVVLDENKKSATMQLQDNDEEEETGLLSVAVGKDAAEDADDGYFLISSSIALPIDVSLGYSLSGTATAGTDYVNPGPEVVLRAGQTSVRVAIEVKADTEVEEDEKVVLSLRPPVLLGLVLDEDRKAATLNIQDDDEEVVLEDVLLSVVVDKAAAEDDKDGFFEVGISEALATDLTIRYSLTGTAEKGKDYSTEPAENELLLKAGKTKEKIKITPIADEEVEEQETIVLTLQTPTVAGVVLDESRKAASMQLEDNDEEVEDVLLSVAVTKHATEKDKDGEFEIEVSEALAADLTIRYRFSGTALNGNDYTTDPEGEQLVLKAGKTKANIKVKKQKKSVEEQTVVLELLAPASDAVVLDENKKAATMRIQSTEEELEQAVLWVKVEKDAGEDNKDGFFELILSKAVDTDLSIDYTLSGTATAGTDYVAPPKPVVLKAGKTSIKLKIEVKADTEVEGEETLILTLQAPATEGVVLDEESKSAVLKIEDNDEEVVEDVLLSVVVTKDASEDNKDGEFELSISKALATDLTIRFNLSGTATPGVDYQTPGGELVLKAGKTKEKIRIKPVADEEVEGDETVILTLQTPSVAGVILDEAGKSATMQLQDNDEEAVVEDVLLSVVVDKAAAEDDKDGFFEVAVSEALATDLTIRYSLTGTAEKGKDYSTEPAENELLLKAGKTKEKIKITPIADEEVEGEETVILTLQSPTAAGVVLDEARKAANLIIEDNDEEVEVEDVLLSVSKSKDAAEDDKDGEFELQVSSPLATDLTIGYSLSGTATAGKDYVFPGEQVVLKAGERWVKVAIHVIADEEVEEEETVILTLQAPTAAGVVLDDDQKEATLEIKDNDEEPQEDVLLSVVVDKAAAEDDKDGFFEVGISEALATDLTIRYSLTGTAEKGKDYSTEPAENELLLKAGKTKEKIKITPIADEEVEEQETIVLTLQTPTVAGVVLDESRKAASMQLEDNDEEVEDVLLSVAVTKHATEKDKDGEFEIEVSEALAADLTIRYRFSGTALNGNDYTTDPEGEQLVLKAGKTKANIKVKKQKKSVEEQTVVLELLAPASDAVVLDENKKAATMRIQSTEEELEQAVLWVKVEKDAGEDNKDGFFELILSKAVDTDLSIDYTLSGTATAGTDYVAPPKPVVLKAGKTSIKLKIEVKADTEVEGEETLILTLQAPATEGVVLDEESKSAVLKIEDNDEEVVEDVLLSVVVTKDASEDNKDGEFELSISKALATDLTIRFNLSGTATPGVDYQTPGGELVLKAGKTKEKIRIKPVADEEVEGDETVILTLQTPSVAGVILDEAGKSATMQLQDNDEEAVVEDVLLSVVVDKAAAEDDKDGFFEVAVSEALATDLTIRYSLTGTAEKGKDYSTEPAENELLLKAGKTKEKIKITPIADEEVEGEETVILTLQSPTAAGVVLDEARKAANLIIEDNDEEVEVEDVLLSVSKSKDAAEDDKDGEFELQVSSPLATDLTIGYSLSGTATAGKDYVSPGESVVLKAGERRVKVAIQVIADEEVEGEETVILTLQTPSAAGVVLDEKKKEDRLKIRDNDKEQEVEDVLLSVAVDRDAAEPDQNGSFIISASEVLEQDIAISFKLSGTAGKNDYTTLTKLEVVLPKGSQNVEVPVQVIDDTEIEEEETVVLELLATTIEGVSLDEARKVATLKIKDNDEDEDEQIAFISVSVGKHAAEDADHGYFLIRSSIALPIDITLSYSLSGTAAAGTDYVSPGQQVTLPAGMRSVRVEVEVEADTEVEDDETVILTLQPVGLTGITLDNAKKTATLNIEDDDEYVFLSVAVDKDAAEDAEDGAFIISSSVVRTTDLTIGYTLSGTAQRDTDYTTVPEQNQVVLKAGQSSVKVVVKVKEDTEVEEDETVVLALETPTTVNVLLEEGKQTASLKIKDNDEEIVEDVLLSVVVDKDAAEDSDEGIFEVAVSKALATDHTIRYSLTGTATPGVDYEIPGGELVLKAGTTTGKIRIKPIADEEVEENETIVLTLENTAAAVVLDESKRTATMQLRDNDEEVEDVLLSVTTDKDAEEDDKDGFFEVAISKALPADLTIRYSLSGTATAGADYDSPGEQLVLKAGTTSEKVRIAVKADAEVEEEETVVLELMDPSIAGVRLNEEKKVATLIIEDNDEAAEENPANTYAVLPTLFTPNGDQMNDVFVLHAKNLRALHWRIYNRHGRLIYETRSLEDATAVGWDGTINGEPQPEDSYIWILVYEVNASGAASTKLTGSVTLIR